MFRQPVFSAALLHMDTGKPHPSATIPVLVQSLTAKRSEGWSFAMSVAGPYLAILFQNFTADYNAEDWYTRTDWNEQEDTLVVWNWHTGERMMVRSFVYSTVVSFGSSATDRATSLCTDNQVLLYPFFRIPRPRPNTGWPHHSPFPSRTPPAGNRR